MSKKLQEEFSLTKHAQDRLRERFPDAMKEIEFEQSAGLRIRKMYEFLWNSTVENRVVNDTLFMQYCHERYGYDKTLKFFVNHDMLFIGVISTHGNYIVTVVNRNGYTSRYLHPTEKKLQKKHATIRKTFRFRARDPSAGTNLFKSKKREYLEADVFDE